MAEENYQSEAQWWVNNMPADFFELQGLGSPEQFLESGFGFDPPPSSGADASVGSPGKSGGPASYKFPGPGGDPQSFSGGGGPSTAVLKFFGGGAQAAPEKSDWDRLQELMAMTSGAPGRINAFEASARPMIEQAIGGGFAASAQSLATGRHQADQDQAYSMAAAGLSPTLFNQFVRPQQNQGYSNQLAGLRGEARAGRAQGNLDLSAQTMNARNQIEQYYDSMMLQRYMAEIAAQAQITAAERAAKSSKQSGAWGAIGSIAAAAIGASDIRLKENVVTLVPGSPRIVSWRWNRAARALGLVGSSVGVIAQELELVAPDRVLTGPDGYKRVIY